MSLFGRKKSGENQPSLTSADIQTALREISGQIHDTTVEMKSLIDDFRADKVSGPDYSVRLDILSVRLDTENNEKARLLALQDAVSRDMGRKALGG